MKPILFNTEMVRGIREGRKTVTRRIVKPRYADSVFEWFKGEFCEASPYRAPEQMGGGVTRHFVRRYMPCEPYCQPSDILWVRETWAHPSAAEIAAGADPNMYLYKADTLRPAAWGKWHPSIHMPKEAARLFLRVTGVRVERLLVSFTAQGDTIAALYDEGIDIGDHCRQCIENYGNPCCNDLDPELEPDENGEDKNGGSECGMLDEVRSGFARLWDSTIKPADRPLYGWQANPWVWVIEFERCDRPTGWPDAVAVPM